MLIPRRLTLCRGSLGFTLVELMVTVSLVAILLALAVPSFNLWINNTRIRTTAQMLQDGLRLAQAEAVRRNRTVSFFLTTSRSPDANTTPAGAPTTTATNWGVRVLPLVVDPSNPTAGRIFVQGGQLTGESTNVTISAALTVVCFNAAGQRVANSAEGCTIDPTSPTLTYQVNHINGDRRLNVITSLGGRVRMCDPAKTLSATNPDGC